MLSEGTPLYRSSVSAEHREALRPFFLLTNKPVLVVVNIGEDDVEKGDVVASPVVEAFASAATPVGVLPICVQLEAEAARLPERTGPSCWRPSASGRGAAPPGARRLPLLGRRTFLTTGDKESRAWTFRAGARAPSAPG